MGLDYGDTLVISIDIYRFFSWPRTQLLPRAETYYKHNPASDHVSNYKQRTLYGQAPSARLNYIFVPSTGFCLKYKLRVPLNSVFRLCYEAKGILTFLWRTTILSKIEELLLTLLPHAASP